MSFPPGISPGNRLPPPPPPPLLSAFRASPHVSPSPPRASPKTKDGLIRMLLQSATPTPPSLPTSPLASPIATPSKPCPPRFPMLMGGNTPIRIMPPTQQQQFRPSQQHGQLTEDDKASSYIHQISGCEREIGLVMLDHPYAKPWNWKPDSTAHSRPTKTLFVPRVSRNQLPIVVPSTPVSEIIDVVGDEPKKSRTLDPEKADLVMNECMRHVNFANPDVKTLAEVEDWEENLSKEGWTLPLHRLFNKTLKILNADRLARLAQEGLVNEPIFRRLMVDKTSKRMRQVLAGVLWDVKLIQWLHNTLCDHLPLEFLAIYFDVLQSLRATIPSLIDKMTAGRVCNPRFAKVTREGLRILLKKKWDPAAASLNEQKMKRLPGNPILILTPSGPSDIWHTGTSRTRHWTSMLSQLGKLVSITMPPVEKEGKTEIGHFLQQTVTAIVNRIREVRRGQLDRSIILVGWGVGAAINCQVAAMESSVTSIVCLGFPMFTLDGVRGEADDPILDLRCPVLFVVGQNACQSRSDDIEDMRERMRGETGLVIVGGADDLLRVSKHKKKAEGVTQSMVDRCIMDDVREFLVSILTSPPPTFVMPSFVTTPSESQPGSARKTPTTRRRKASTNPDGSPVVKRAKKARAAGSTPAKSAPGISPLASGTPGALGQIQAMSASLTPTTVVPKAKGGDGIQKARKVLDMSQKSKAETSTNIMASSPLLSSALTSPTKTTTATSTTSRLVSTTSLSTPIVLPTKPTALPLRQPTIIHPPMPSLASMLQQPNALPPPTIVMPSPKPRPQFTPPAPTIVRMVSTPAKQAEPQKPHVFQGPNPSGTPTTMMLLTSQGSKISTASFSKALVQTVTAAGTRFTVPVSAQSVSVKKSPSGAPLSKDNLYIVSLPTDQLKNLEGSNLVQYSGSQMLTLLSDKAKNEPSMRTLLTEAKSESLSSSAPEASGSTERRNVAEILASLSGLVPEPPKKSEASSDETVVTAIKSEAKTIAPLSNVATTSAKVSAAPPRPSAAILSTHSGPSRIVRVLQTGGGRLQTVQQPVNVKATEVTLSPGASMRSRKQIFVTAAPKEMGNNPLKIEGSKAEEGLGKGGTSTERHVTNYDQDILEEDVGDLEYIPYPKKKSSPKQKGKCKGNKK